MTVIRREDGSHRKENPAITASIENENIMLRMAINRAQIAESLKDHPGWGAVRDSINDKITNLDRQLDFFNEKEHRNIDLLLQKRQDLKGFIAMVDEVADSIAEFEIRIARNEKALNERKQSTPV